MEFHEKLQELRKKRGLTQEELAEALYVSRTAISKWESGRGYPSIDSLKEISNFFSISIDDLLSSEKLLSIAEKENKSTIRSMCDSLFGMIDVFAFLLIVLPLYPKEADTYIYSVNLFTYTETLSFTRVMHWIFLLALIVCGVLKCMLVNLKKEKKQTLLTICSMVISILTVIFLALTREPYAVMMIFLLFVIKGVLLLKMK